jgi:hypothetical protein
MTPDPRVVGRAHSWLDETGQTPVGQLPPSALMEQLDAARIHLAAVLAVISELDAWQPGPERPMDCSDVDPETGEAFGVDPAADESQLQPS